jgi:hypothetical protein
VRPTSRELGDPRLAVGRREVERTGDAADELGPEHTIRASAQAPRMKPFVFARESFVTRTPSDGSRFVLKPDARARKLLAAGNTLRVVVTVTEHPMRGHVDTQFGYGSLSP